MILKAPNLPSAYDLYLFGEGNLFRGYRVLGAHLQKEKGGGNGGVRFVVWAPHALQVKVAGEFNNWQPHRHPLQRLKDSGIWALFVPEAREGQLYKYEIHGPGGEVFLKADPFAFASEQRPGTASRIVSLEGYRWGDGYWQGEKKKKPPYERPLLIYEVHLGSWRRKENGAFYSYRQLAEELVDYAAAMGYTHLELLPLTEHPFDASWGYQATGYFSLTSRYGGPQDFMCFVDRCHQKGLGVIMDWVPGHFCKDAHGLRRFDGTPLYEYKDPRRAESPDWDTLCFDLGSPQVQNFLISSALFWMDIYHIDGLRVDAVASMLYLDYGRKGEEWVPNIYGGRENLEGVSFLQKLNRQVFKYYPEALMIAEESTAWPQVTTPIDSGGLGFNFKWNMGWMNDTLSFMEKDPLYRKWHHNQLTFSFWYAFAENFILPLSHDEVVHGKKALLEKMPGDYWQKFANQRLLYGYMAVHPGKMLHFMGGEFGQFREWSEEWQLDWNLLEYDMHRKLQHYLRQLNLFYLSDERLWELDCTGEGFEWVDPHDCNQNIATFMRRDRGSKGTLIAVCNFTPVFHEDYRIGVPLPGSYREIFNSDMEDYGGSGQLNRGLLEAYSLSWHNQPFSLRIKVPPLALAIFEPLKNRAEQ